MSQYSSAVLHERYYDVISGHHKYPYAISVAEVLRIAGIKSRSTLSATHHAALKAELDAFIADLKRKAGKIQRTEDSDALEEKRSDRIDQMAQTIAALQYKIIALEQEIVSLKSQTQGRVVNIKG